MVSEIVEVIVKVFEGIKKENSLQDVEKLLPTGSTYKKNIIPAAFNWINEKSGRDNLQDTQISVAAESGFRILSNEEKSMFGEDIEKYLMHLYSIGLLKSNDIDKIFEQEIGRASCRERV